MKKLILAVAVVASFIAMGDTWTDPKTGITWTYTVNGGEASVKGANPASGDIAIPSTLGSNPVTSIGERAFRACGELTGVTIPNSVTNIGDYAFYNCSGLKLVTIPSSVTSIVRGAFYGCSGMISFVVDSQNPKYQSVNGLLLSKDGKNLLAGVNGDVVIPSSVTSIGGYTFEHCSGLTSVMIPSSVTHVGWEAFNGCSGLKSVTIPSSVIDIALLAFGGCSGLTSFVVDSQNPNYQSVDGLLLTKDGTKLVAGVNGDVVIPSSVTIIEEFAFDGFSGLTSVTIPDGVTSIDYCVFCGCSGLKSVTIPSSVTSIGQGAFGGCSGLTSVTIPSSVTNVGNSAFSGCRGLTSMTIPEGVTSIGDNAFSMCFGLTSVTIPEGVTNIGNSAFSRCCGLTSVTIPEGVTSIGDEAFFWCSGLTSVEIPSSVTSIGGRAFSWCDGLTSVTIPSSVTNIGDGAFCGCSGLAAVDFEGVPPDGIGNASIKTDAVIRYNVAYENEWLPVVKECGWTNATPYELLPDGGPYKEVVDGVEWTFMVKGGVSSLGNEYPITAVPVSTEGELTIPSSLGGRQLRVIGESAFYDCTNITAVTMPNCVISISMSAFSHCTGLVSARIPSSVNVFGKLAFNGCSNLADVYFEGDSIKECPSDAFKNCHWDLIMHVPATWKGRGKTLCGYTVVRDGEDEGVIAANLTVTNVVVQYVLNSVQPEIAVPVSGDTGFTTIITEVKSAGAVSVPSEWKDNYPAFESKFGSNFVKALMWKTGKKDGANNDMFVWQDYVAGTDPTNPDDKFTASITMVDGVPVISYAPELSDAQKALREYKTFGKKQLQDNWTDVTNFDGEAKKPYNFFKVTVEMR